MMFKTHLVSERKQRSLATNIIGDNMEAEFMFTQEGGGQGNRGCPFCIPNLVRKVSFLLGHNYFAQLQY